MRRQVRSEEDGQQVENNREHRALLLSDLFSSPPKGCLRPGLCSLICAPVFLVHPMAFASFLLANKYLSLLVAGMCAVLKMVGVVSSQSFPSHSSVAMEVKLRRDCESGLQCQESLSRVSGHFFPSLIEGKKY